LGSIGRRLSIRREVSVVGEVDLLVVPLLVVQPHVHRIPSFDRSGDVVEVVEGEEFVVVEGPPGRKRVVLGAEAVEGDKEFPGNKGLGRPVLAAVFFSRDDGAVRTTGSVGGSETASTFVLGVLVLVVVVGMKWGGRGRGRGCVAINGD
jgi:hypothetical protein